MMDAAESHKTTAVIISDTYSIVGAYNSVALPQNFIDSFAVIIANTYLKTISNVIIMKK